MRGGWRVVVKTVAIAATLAIALGLALVLRPNGPAAPDARPRPEPQMLSALAEPQAERDDADRGEQDNGDPPLLIPVEGVRREQLSDTFSQARAAGARRHDAIDIMAPRGARVVAAADGRVEKLFLSKDGGNTVYVRAPGGRRLYYYAHLDRYAPDLAENGWLRRGQPVGTVGATGNANPAAPHLHFAVWMTSPERKWWESAIALNPYPLLRQRSER